MNVLSLFDGMSCGRIALERSGIKVDNYFASEIDKHAIKVSKANYSDIKHIGDVCKLDTANLPRIDLLIGGSPCQSISNLGDGSGLEGKSGLFYQYVRVLQETKPTNFILENVLGNKKAIQAISNILGVEPVLFNSNLVSAQNRKRLYWTNIDFSLPNGSDKTLEDVLDAEVSADSLVSTARLKWLLSEKGQQTVRKGYAVIDPIKANCLTARSDASWNCNYVTRNGVITKLSPEEYEKLQTVPVGYTNHVSTSQRYKMLGNGWTVDVIAHILNGLKPV